MGCCWSSVYYMQCESEKQHTCSFSPCTVYYMQCVLHAV